MAKVVRISDKKALLLKEVSFLLVREIGKREPLASTAWLEEIEGSLETLTDERLERLKIVLGGMLIYRGLKGGGE